MQAVDIYGLSEIIGPGVARECAGTQDGLHGWEDHFLFEVIDPETLEPLPEGESRRAGHHHADQGSAADDPLPHARHHALDSEPCACGRTHVRIMRVTGRNDDMLIIRGVNVFPRRWKRCWSASRGWRRTTRSF